MSNFYFLFQSIRYLPGFYFSQRRTDLKKYGNQCVKSYIFLEMFFSPLVRRLNLCAIKSARADFRSEIFNHHRMSTNVGSAKIFLFKANEADVFLKLLKLGK